MDADPKSPDSKKDAPRRSMERLVRRFGAVWVASQDGMAAIGATRKDALAGWRTASNARPRSIPSTQTMSARTVRERRIYEKEI
jgi:hypothetical protein